MSILLEWRQRIIKDTNVSKGILGSANYLTAEICASTQNQPANVCRASYIQQIQRSLSNPSTYVGDRQLLVYQSTFDEARDKKRLRLT